MPSQMYFMELARRCRFLSHHTLDLRIARELRVMAEELEKKAREARLAADAAVPAIVQHYAPR
jgi:phage-related minor tail protein